MTPHERPGPTRAARFGHFTSEAARAAGYDIDGQRSGGRKALAKATGMGQTAVGRMLSGQSVPAPQFFEALAGALHVDLRTLLIEAELISEDALAAVAEAAAPAPGPLTPQEAAAALGITIPANVQLFITMVENMQGQEDDGPKVRRRGVA